MKGKECVYCRQTITITQHNSLGSLTRDARIYLYTHTYKTKEILAKKKMINSIVKRISHYYQYV